MKALALVVLNGDITEYDSLRNQTDRVLAGRQPEIVIGVDGGINHLEGLGFTPTHALGDFDSIDRITEIEAKYPDVKWLEFPTEKDFTDSELALEILSHMINGEIIIVGAFGGRLDHMIGTVFLMNRYSDSSHRILMIDEQNQLELLTGPSFKVIGEEAKKFKYVSIIPMTSQVTGVTLREFKYPLDRATIKMGETVGISNECMSLASSLEFETGKLLMIYSNDLIKA